MSELTFMLAGTAADAAADELVTVLDLGGQAVDRRPGAAASRDDRKGLIELATLILSVPGAVLAVMDIVDRIAKRRRAQAVIDTARRLRRERQVETYLMLPADIRQSVADLDPDRLLDLVAALPPPAPEPPLAPDGQET